ncbi:hypothetical protein [Salinibacterium sp. ZJ450]|uniref:hypothetical protein n=1 Tax=Salinibacterium sp. ZJ450 TaxID=2708338 RepID=UPI001423597D|nr:hypothetical protein [Salinibacterium sp. ZJ450]
MTPKEKKLAVARLVLAKLQNDTDMFHIAMAEAVMAEAAAAVPSKDQIVEMFVQVIDGLAHDLAAATLAIGGDLDGAIAITRARLAEIELE